MKLEHSGGLKAMSDEQLGEALCGAYWRGGERD